MISRPAVAALLLTGALGAAGCSSDDTPTAPAQALASALSAPVPGLSLPADPLRALVPSPDEVPPGMVPLLTGSGPRSAAAIAEYSADPAAAAVALADHGFAGAYVAQYADPAGARVLSVVVVRFTSAAGATADLAGDLAASSGDLVETDPVGDASQVRRQPLPGGDQGQLVTVRFRRGATTWLLAYGDRPEADPAVAVGLGSLLASRA